MLMLNFKVLKKLRNLKLGTNSRYINSVVVAEDGKFWKHLKNMDILRKYSKKFSLTLKFRPPHPGVEV